MKYLMMMALVLLSGCSQEVKYIDGKTLWDKHGCAFIARRNIGNNLFLEFNQDLSKDGCLYIYERNIND